MFQKPRLPLRPDARNSIEQRRADRFGAQPPVVADRESVRLIADVLHEMEDRRRRQQHDRIGLAGDKDLLLAFRQSDDRHGPADGFQLPERRAQLPLPTVDQDEVGPR